MAKIADMMAARILIVCFSFLRQRVQMMMMGYGIGPFHQQDLRLHPITTLHTMRKFILYPFSFEMYLDTCKMQNDFGLWQPTAARGPQET